MPHPDEQSRTATVEVTDACCIQQAVLDVLDVPVMVIGSQCMVWANSAARSMIEGASAEPAIGCPLARMIPPELQDAAEQRRRLAMESGTVFADVAIKVARLDGTSVPARSHMRAVDTAAGRYVLQVVWQLAGVSLIQQPPAVPPLRSITKMHKCVHRAAFECAPMSLVVHTRTHVLKANSEARRRLGAPAVLDGTPLGNFIHPDFAAASAERNAVLFDTGLGFDNASSKFVRFDGASVHASGDGRAIDYAGERFGVHMVREIRSAL